VTYTLSANVENLTHIGAGAINGTGNVENNILTGNGAANVLDGEAGDDTLLGTAGNDTLLGGADNDRLDGGTGTDAMTGGTGNDTYVVDASSDTVTEAVNEGIDTVESSITYTLGENVENLTLTGSATINGTGNSFDNILFGNSGNNSLSGGAGNDRLDGGMGIDAMSGGTGDDIYVVDTVGDAVSESSNQGTDTVQSSITYALGSNVENLRLLGTANIKGTGNSLSNALTGNSGNNQLDGGSGNDTVDGGDGNDNLLGVSGNDMLLGGLGNDTLAAGSGNDILDGGEGADTLDGGSGDDQLLGGTGADTLSGGSGADQFTGGAGNDQLMGGSGNDLYNFSREDGQDTIIDQDPFSGNQDKALFGAGINPIDLIISQQANDLRISIYGTTDQLTIQNWYTSTNNQNETVQAGNGQQLLNTKVDQLIQAMATFGAQTGLTWEQAIAQRPQDVQNILAASWH
jgi:Ca2+-binding RTX toxin-like protein